MWPNGQVYDGEFKNDDCNGFGILHYPDGKRYEGNWKDGKKHMKGHYVWPNGSKYAVMYQEGVKKEQGKLESENVSMDQLKLMYGSLSKKAAASISALQAGAQEGQKSNTEGLFKGEGKSNPWSAFDDKDQGLKRQQAKKNGGK